MDTITTAFPDEGTYQKIYDECMENMPQATEVVRNSYEDMRRALDEYISAISEGMFRYAYQCGYEAAVKTMQMQKGGATSCRGKR